MNQMIIARPMLLFVQALVLVIATCFSSLSLAQDWSQILGPNRNGIAEDEQLLDEWPESGPKTIWSVDVGQGFAGPIVAGQHVIVYHLMDGHQVVQAFDRKTGDEVWSRKWKSEYAGAMDGDKGPKCVPLAHGDKVYLHGPAGTLTCLRLKDGEQVWQKPTANYEFGRGFFGVGSTPIVMDEKLIVNVGGNGAAVVAFDLNDGSELWKSFDDRASYSSPVAAKLGDAPIVALVSRFHLLGLDPKSGDIKFKFEFGRRGPTVNGAMPVYADGHLFVNSSYGVGSLLVDVSGDQAKEVWANKTAFASQYSTPVFYKGHLYGLSGREDMGNGSLRCIEMKTGKVVWQTKMPIGHVMLVGDKLLVNDFRGGLHVVAAKPDDFELLSTAQVFRGAARVPPALSDGMLYVRENAKPLKAKLICLQVGE